MNLVWGIFSQRTGTLLNLVAEKESADDYCARYKHVHALPLHVHYGQIDNSVPLFVTKEELEAREKRLAKTRKAKYQQ